MPASIRTYPLDHHREIGEFWDHLPPCGQKSEGAYPAKEEGQEVSQDSTGEEKFDRG